jgi:hypothetical protein
MARHVLLVLSNPAAGCDDEFNDWYTNEHLPDVLAVDGFVAAQRFRLCETQLQPGRPAPHRYLAVYEIEADDVSVPLQALLAGVTSGLIPLSDMLDLPSLATFAFTPITDRATT